ncbi:MAG: tetrathionate reductase family octaheme c-type cytochrome [Candidatus Eisenbacteria bacterium]|uniref:Tetrathionate reductase family octaheme c-type cytochrome n=1 Tax=Eiseniibacteriota bacterium TaxID=2212470 RepID=A0A948WBR9_UNCEI|nr:tetrathionate reductase family octaheme c-type cytochrome [Candidatus Eisenbacteria bacterium]MBU2690233.1 tetrathionate reductase family octaheme c-type cytochrome [Candidatus Eisenbacteria bacterium]
MKIWRLPLITLLLLLTQPVHAAIQEHIDALEGPFSDGPSVTEACLNCHEDAARDFMKTTHWTWSSQQELADRKGPVERGKKNAINNFCISLPGNWPRCTSCHAGYGWEDDTFDFENARNVDCLVCHDATGSYKKFPTGAGHPAYETKESAGTVYPAPDLTHVAQNVGMPDRRACGSCHFFGGGGNAIKHGDLDESLVEPQRTFDVHMGIDGENMSCQSCHLTENHQISGNALVVSPGGKEKLDCTRCHEAEPHIKNAKMLNSHCKRVACQTCHIPTFAKGAPTKVWWDWSDAGKDLASEVDAFGMPTFSKQKGSFSWDREIVPTYAWYNGEGGAYQLGDVIDPDQIVTLNWPAGSHEDSTAKIYPFKKMRGRQIYDTGHKIMITPKLFGKTGYWTTFDWNSAAAQGMAATGLDYSGSYGWVETEMYWKINHMVVPKEDALKCNTCHGSKGRLDWTALGYDGDPRKAKN